MGHGTPPVTHTYIKPTSNQRSTTSRAASAAGRLRPNDVRGNLPVHFLEMMSAKRSANTLSFFGRWCDLRVRQEQRDVLLRLR